ncbi:hypothetical protein Patl1_13599 [Pistacia atlantica]|uniref:Uncharacterized protein n=1 Tax=Pistacia atlantica TaxID=434234 RepID=A0ACC1AYK1_9ROSI|nr:hypothetical protein Patl1_13599 [Pistacia atlantica]
MAGLQYYFFPTDFFHPRPPLVNGDHNTKNPILSFETPQKDNEDDNIQKPTKATVIRHHMPKNKLHQPSCIVKDEMNSTKLNHNIANYWISLPKDYC